MDLILVRHGESSANVEGRLQGQRDYPLTRRGRAQAEALAAWSERSGLSWDAAYCSPLSRAKETAEIISRARTSVVPQTSADLREFDAGALQGLLHHQIRERFPEFFERELSEYADYSRWGGESYDDIVERVRRVRAFLELRHRKAADRVLVVGHGGFGTEVVKHLVCEPAPRSFNVKFGNCTAILVRMSERFQTYIGRMIWQVPVEHMQGASGPAFSPGD